MHPLDQCCDAIYFNAMPLRILALGDIVGRPGRQVIHQKLAALVRQRQIDLVIANAENIAGGSGITPNLSSRSGITFINGWILFRLYRVPSGSFGQPILRQAPLVGHLPLSKPTAA
jgi:hypothetical protein